MKTTEETSGTTLKQTFTLQGSPKEKKEKVPDKVFEKMIAEKFPNMGKKIVNQVQRAESLRQDKPKEEHTETHSNQTDKN